MRSKDPYKPRCSSLWRSNRLVSIKFLAFDEIMERTKKEWIDWANEKGFAKEDAKRALADLSGTIDKIQALTAFAQFAGFELKESCKNNLIIF
jgi:hypothetical protein